MSLENKHVVVLGGSSGIGLETALHAKKLGAKVSIAGRSMEKLQLAKKMANFDIYQLDNKHDDQIKAFFDSIGAFDHLFTPAASYDIGPITSDKEVAENCFSGKFWPQYMAVKYGVSNIQKNGSIVLMSGAASQRIPKGFSIAMYVACNSAIEGLVRGLAVELAPNIRVNGVSPGTIATPLWENRDRQLREQAYSIYREHSLLEKVGTAIDVAQAVIYLMINENTTGSILFPDGGFTLR